jgi:hypothetical protein
MVWHGIAVINKIRMLVWIRYERIIQLTIFHQPALSITFYHRRSDGVWRYMCFFQKKKWQLLRWSVVVIVPKVNLSPPGQVEFRTTGASQCVGPH